MRSLDVVLLIEKAPSCASAAGGSIQPSVWVAGSLVSTLPMGCAVVGLAF